MFVGEERVVILAKGETPLTGVKLVIYKKIVQGDFRKFRAESNDTPSGGGARDLRFSPANEFTQQFNRMFNGPGTDGTLTGRLYWNGLPPTDVIIHQPTNARPNEVRIGTVHQCFPSQVLPVDSNDCILLLVLDNEDRVWPSFTTEHSLRNDNWHPAVKEPILRGLHARRSDRVTPMGYVDIENGREWTNGR